MLLAFDYSDISSNFHESDELHILKRLDIDKDFIYDKYYNDLKNSLKKGDIKDFQKAIETNPKIFLTLKEIVKNSNVPDLFLYMAMIESEFLIDARSHKKAAGLWQIVPQTAKLLRLKVNKYVDERLDPIKSTKAAISYLSYLHDRFKKWYLVALAYNCGETKLASAIKKAQSDDIFALLDPRYNYLPKETKNYIRRLLVSALIANAKPVQNSISKIKKQNTLLSSISYKDRKSLKDISEIFKVPLSEIKKYNAHILDGVISKNTPIYLPSNYIKKEKISAQSIYTTKKSQTLYSISKKLHISFETLKKLNPKLPLLIPKNHHVKLPKSNTLPSSEIKFQPLNNIVKNHKIIKYIVKKGETLYTISLKFNNKISALKRLNPNIGYDLKIGQEIKVIE